MQQQVRDEAVQILVNMREIVNADMIERGEYISDQVENQARAESGAICHGHKACAIGSLWLGAGVRIKRGSYGASLPGIDSQRAFVRRRPPLKAAFDAMNDATRWFMDTYPEHDATRSYGYTTEAWASVEYAGFESKMESFFERADLMDITLRGAMLKIIARALRQLRGVEVTA